MINSFDGKYRFLSNFYPAPIFFDGIVYPTNEHFYQSMKTDNIEIRRSIAACYSPSGAKGAGRAVGLPSNWNEMKVKVMLFGLRQKFNRPILSEMLLNTGQEVLIEGNHWHDNFWGACSCQRCSLICKNNMLGRLLMQVRKEIITNPSAMFWRK